MANEHLYEQWWGCMCACLQVANDCVFFPVCMQNLSDQLSYCASLDACGQKVSQLSGSRMGAVGREVTDTSEHMSAAFLVLFKIEFKGP